MGGLDDGAFYEVKDRDQGARASGMKVLFTPSLSRDGCTRFNATHGACTKRRLACVCGRVAGYIGRFSKLLFVSSCSCGSKVFCSWSCRAPRWNSAKPCLPHTKLTKK